MDSHRRKELVEAMAQAAWWKSGEPKPWDKLPASVRQEWTSYLEAALVELENRVPKIHQILEE